MGDRISVCEFASITATCPALLVSVGSSRAGGVPVTPADAFVLPRPRVSVTTCGNGFRCSQKRFPLLLAPAPEYEGDIDCLLQGGS